jgi:multimeric flavodoxin WrbA
VSKTLLVVHHTPSPYMQEMFEAILSGATDPEIQGVEVVRRPALTVSPTDMLEADGYLLGSPANPRLYERSSQALFGRIPVY